MTNSRLKELSGHVACMGERKNFPLENLKGRDQLGDQDVNGRMMMVVMITATAIIIIIIIIIMDPFVGKCCLD
jgi:hypothetical protein